MKGSRKEKERKKVPGPANTRKTLRQAHNQRTERDGHNARGRRGKGREKSGPKVGSYKACSKQQVLLQSKLEMGRGFFRYCGEGGGDFRHQEEGHNLATLH